jgi:predicted alpha-1,2-mannosidase
MAALTTSPGTNFDSYAAPFDHSNEHAHPGYYAITLANGIRVEITVAERSGIARFIFPAGADARLLINAGSSANGLTRQIASMPYEDIYGNSIELTSANSYAGSVTAGNFCSSDSHYKLYVAGRFNKPYKTSALWQDNTILSNAKSAHGKHSGAWLDFGNQNEVVLKVGISYVSQAGALDNLNREIPGWNFDKVRAEARSTWSRLLDRIAVEGGSSDQRKIFYTSLYHSFLCPTVFSDRDGNYIGFDNQVRSLAASKQKAQYANFSDWDIYRNTVQMQALFDPARTSDMMQSLVNDAVQSGWLPRWPVANDVTYVMGGDSPAILLSSSYAFGARDFDLHTALKYMVKAGIEPGIGPHGGSERPFLRSHRQNRHRCLGYARIRQRRLRRGAVCKKSRRRCRLSFIPQAISKLDVSLRSIHRLDSPPPKRRNLVARIRRRPLTAENQGRLGQTGSGRFRGGQHLPVHIHDSIRLSHSLRRHGRRRQSHSASQHIFLQTSLLG